MLLLYNCNTHRGLDKNNVRRYCGIPQKLIVIFLPSNVTSGYQPMDMGIIACFKVGYYVQLLEYLIKKISAEEGYEALKAPRKRAKPGYKGLRVGGKPTMLDLMDLSIGIWNGDTKYDL